MWARVVCLVAIGACYAPPGSLAGTRCDPQAGCPYGLTCELVDGEHLCVATPPGPSPDAAAAPSWTIVQVRGQEDRNLNLPEQTGADHAIIVALETTAGALPNLVDDDAGNTYQRLDTSRARHVIENVGLELWIAVASRPGAKRIMSHGGIVRAVVAWEVAGLDGANPVVAIAAENDQTETESPTGAKITTDAPGQFVLSIAIVANAVDGLTPGSAFESDSDAFGNGWAHLAAHDAPAATYQAEWVQPVKGGYCTTSAAFRIKP